MKRSVFALIAVFVATINSVAQTQLTGKWENEQTTIVTDGRTLARPNPFDPSGKSQLAPATTKEQPRTPRIQLNLRLVGNQVTGSIIEADRSGTLVVEEGLLTGKTFMFKTNRATPQGMETVLWKGEVVDSASIVVVPTLLRPIQPPGTTKELGLNESAAGPGLPGAGRTTPPQDVKTVGGALVLRRSN